VDDGAQAVLVDERHGPARAVDVCHGPFDVDQRDAGCDDGRGRHHHRLSVAPDNLRIDGLAQREGLRPLQGGCRRDRRGEERATGAGGCILAANDVGGARVDNDGGAVDAEHLGLTVAEQARDNAANAQIPARALYADRAQVPTRSLRSNHP